VGSYGNYVWLESLDGVSTLQTTEQSRVQVWGEEIMERKAKR
jgi:hypothetical protein